MNGMGMKDLVYAAKGVNQERDGQIMAQMGKKQQLNVSPNCLLHFIGAEPSTDYSFDRGTLASSQS